MKNQQSKILIFLLVSHCCLSSAKNLHSGGFTRTNQKLSSVELQWEDSPGAFMYEVEILNSKGKQIKSFVSKSSLFRFKSTSGKIKIRGRVIDAYGKRGLWSEPTVAEVPPEDLKFPTDPASQNPINGKASASTNKATVTLAWPEATQAQRYLVKVFDKDDKIIQQKETANLTERFEIPTGAYSYTVTPIGVDNVAGKEIRSPQKIQIGGAQLPKITFQVSNSNRKLSIKIPKRNIFEVYGALEYANHLSEVWTPVAAYSPFAEDIWTPDDKLKPGRYRIGFWTTLKDWIDSDKFYHEFVIKPTEAEIEASDNAG